MLSLVVRLIFSVVTGYVIVGMDTGVRVRVADGVGNGVGGAVGGIGVATGPVLAQPLRSSKIAATTVR